jgi:hypothetical protein
MSHTKKAAQQKRRIKGMPVLGVAGLSFSLAGGTSATIGSMDPDTATSVLVAEQVMDEEQIPEVSLATFHLFDDARVGRQPPRTRPTMISQGACGADLYYPQNSPVVSGPAYQPTSPPRARPIRPARKYKHS